MEVTTIDDGDKCYDMFVEAYRLAGKALRPKAGIIGLAARLAERERQLGRQKLKTDLQPR